MQRQDLERMTREQLIAQAERLGIQRPRVLTQPELVDEIIGRTSKNDRERTKARGWLGRARDLLARVVERGLHLPEAARVLRKDGEDKSWPAPPPPLPTVTLAEIYAAQGHLDRAIAVLDAVIAREPDHREAKTMRARFSEQAHRSRSRVGHDGGRAPKPSRPPGPAGHPKDPPPTHEATVEDPDTDPSLADTLPDRRASPATAANVIEAAAPASKEDEPTVVKDEHAADADAALLPATVSGAIHVKPAASPSDVELPGVAPGSLTAEPTEPPAPELEPLALEPELLARPTPKPPAQPAGDAGPDLTLAPLDEPPLPDRYEVDEIVAIAVDPRTIYLYWEVRPTTLAHVRAEHPDGWLCVRVATVTASWEGPVVDARDLHVDALYGDRFLRDIQPGSNVRVSVGWRSADGFEPFAVGSEVTAPRVLPAEPVTHEVARWEAEPAAARFPSRRIESVSMAPPPYVARFGGAPAPEAVALSAAAFVERARAVGDHGGPVDTGVALWGPPPAEGTLPYPYADEAAFETGAIPPHEEELDEEPTEEAARGWLEPGGSSELGRGGPARRLRPGRGRRLVPGVLGRPGPPGWSAGAPPLAVAAPRGVPGEAAAFGGASDLSPGGASELSF